MKERPILFSGPMVRSILEGRKTMTRRVVKGVALDWLTYGFTPEFVADPANHLCTYVQSGDRLWVRETWAVLGRVHGDPIRACDLDNPPSWRYRADGGYGCWRPSIHMPRKLSRLTLEVISVRVERLQDITDDDAEAEGVDITNASISGYCRERFRKLWDSINLKRGYGWDANQWVWVVEFKKL